MFSYLTIPVNFSLPFRPHKHLNLHILLTLQTTRKTLPSYSPYPSDHTEKTLPSYSPDPSDHTENSPNPSDHTENVTTIFSFPFRPHRKLHHHILLTLQNTQTSFPIIFSLHIRPHRYSPYPSDHTDNYTIIFFLTLRPHRHLNHHILLTFRPHRKLYHHILNALLKHRHIYRSVLPHPKDTYTVILSLPCKSFKRHFYHLILHTCTFESRQYKCILNNVHL